MFLSTNYLLSEEADEKLHENIGNIVKDRNFFN